MPAHRACTAAPNFCEAKTFPDLPKLSVCMPTIGAYDSGKDFIQHYITFNECRGIVGDDCSAAREYLYGGMGCAKCGAWADVATLGEADCARHTDQADCIGSDSDGHLFQEVVGAPGVAAEAPAAEAVPPPAPVDAAVGDAQEQVAVDDEVPGGDDGTGTSQLVNGPGAPCPSPSPYAAVSIRLPRAVDPQRTVTGSPQRSQPPCHSPTSRSGAAFPRHGALRCLAPAWPGTAANTPALAPQPVLRCSRAPPQHDRVRVCMYVCMCL